MYLCSFPIASIEIKNLECILTLIWLFEARLAFIILFNASATISSLMLTVFFKAYFLRYFSKTLPAQIQIILPNMPAHSPAAPAFLYRYSELSYSRLIMAQKFL